MMTCPRCGGATPPGKFCGQCGAPLQQAPFPQPAARRSSGLIIGLAVGGVALLALVGVGILALSVGDDTPVRSAAPAGPSSPPPASSGAPASKPKAAAAKPNWIMGTVTDAAGNPLKVAQSEVVLRITGDLNDGMAYKRTLSPDSSWRYGVEIPPGSFTASGYVAVNFEGKEFWLPLDPVGGSKLQDSTKGIVKDLQWKLSGLRPGADANNPYSYYGSFVFMLYQGSGLPEGAKVTFTATPVTPLADGSKGKNLTFEATAAELRKGKNLMDMPLARYRISGEVTMPDGSRKQALLSGASGAAATAQEFVFTPNAMGEGMEGVSLWMTGVQ